MCRKKINRSYNNIDAWKYYANKVQDIEEKEISGVLSESKVPLYVFLEWHKVVVREKYGVTNYIVIGNLNLNCN